MKKLKEFFVNIDPKSIIFIGDSSRKFESSVYSIFDKEKILTIFVDANNFENLPKTDLVIWIGFEPKSQRKHNVEILQKLTEITDKIVFSSRVPCYGAKSIYFWPSHWCEVFDDFGYDYSTDLKSILWYDSILTPFELEGLVFFEKKNSANDEESRSAEVNLLHPQHGCDHFLEVKETRLARLYNRAKTLNSSKTFMSFEAINRESFRKEVSSKTTSEQKILAAPVEGADVIKLMGFHPGHGCRHKHADINFRLDFKSYLLKHLNFARRERIKAFVPSWIVLRAKRLLLK